MGIATRITGAVAGLALVVVLAACDRHGFIGRASGYFEGGKVDRGTTTYNNNGHTFRYN